MDAESTTNEPQRIEASKSDLTFNIGLTVAEVGLSVLLFQIARSAGLAEVGSYLLAAVVPVLGLGVYFLRYRTLSAASFLILGFTLLSAAAALLALSDAEILLFKDVAVTAMVGLLFLVSLVWGKPLSFYFGQRFAAAGTPAGRKWWYGLWQYEGFRKLQRQITIVWAVVFLIEAAIKLVVVNGSSFDQAFIFVQVLPFAAVGVAMWLTVWIGNSARHNM